MRRQPTTCCYNAGQMTEEPIHLPSQKADPEEPPPIFGTWRKFYLVVIVNTVAVYLLLLLFSHYAGR